MATNEDSNSETAASDFPPQAGASAKQKAQGLMLHLPQCPLSFPNHYPDPAKTPPPPMPSCGTPPLCKLMRIQQHAWSDARHTVSAAFTAAALTVFVEVWKYKMEVQ